MSDTLLRQIEMLRLVPTAPRKIDTTQLRQKLADMGYHTTSRTIQRNLQDLSLIFPLESDEKSTPYGWSWRLGAPQLGIPSMEPQVALSLKMAEQFLSRLMPLSSLGHLAGYFRLAEQVLSETAGNGYRGWTSKVVIAQRTQALLPPAIPAGVLDAVYTGLMQERCLRIRYSNALSSQTKMADIHPLGIIVREPVIYLVCTFWDFGDLRQLALHRIEEAEIVDEPVKRPDGFCLHSYVDKGQLDIQLKGEIQLRARVSERQARYLQECALAPDQRLSHEGPGGALLTATLADTLQLRRWILSLTGEIEVLAPDYLRKEIGRQLHEQSLTYSPQEVTA